MRRLRCHIDQLRVGRYRCGICSKASTRNWHSLDSPKRGTSQQIRRIGNPANRPQVPAQDVVSNAPPPALHFVQRAGAHVQELPNPGWRMRATAMTHRRRASTDRLCRSTPPIQQPALRIFSRQETSAGWGSWVCPPKKIAFLVTSAVISTSNPCGGASLQP